MRIRGPKGQFKYHPELARELGMIAGGTGITPMLQITRAALKDPRDRTRISLIFANVSAEDVLLKKEIDELARAHAHRFRVFYVLNNPPPAWDGGVGFVSKEMIEAHMPPSDHNIKILLCGAWPLPCPCVAELLCVLTCVSAPARPSAHDHGHEVSADRAWAWLCHPCADTLCVISRKHLAELNYPAPRTVSKLEDQVRSPP